MSDTRQRREFSDYSHTDTVGAFPAPEATGGACCYGAAFGGDCTCWRPRTEPVQEPLQEGPMPVRRKACEDCAYRHGSPERVELGGELPDYGRHRPFACHQGMPQVVEYVHGETGDVMLPPSDDYLPVMRGGRAWLADGRPAEWCAGWAAVNRVRSGS